jgi:hypothetical protein
MFDHYPTDDYGERRFDRAAHFPPLPTWLATRILKADEQVTWVRGPRFNPSWERHVTHIRLFLAALVLGAILVAAGWLFNEMAPGAVLVCILIALAVVVGSIMVLGLCCGYFTRLVVTNSRVLILQGYEVCRCWGINQLPRSMVRYRAREDGETSPTIDLDAMKTMLGGASDHFADAKTILAFGKTLGQIKAREDGRP